MAPTTLGVTPRVVGIRFSIGRGGLPFGSRVCVARRVCVGDPRLCRCPWCLSVSVSRSPAPAPAPSFVPSLRDKALQRTAPHSEVTGPRPYASPSQGQGYQRGQSRLKLRFPRIAPRSIGTLKCARACVCVCAIRARVCAIRARVCVVITEPMGRPSRHPKGVA